MDRGQQRLASLESFPSKICSVPTAAKDLIMDDIITIAVITVNPPCDAADVIDVGQPLRPYASRKKRVYGVPVEMHNEIRG